MRYQLLSLVLVLAVFGCAADQPQRFNTTEVVWKDTDRHPIPEPEEYWSGLYWDGADKMFFRPVSHAFLLEEWGPAANTNALDEVPNSSWYTNRMALRTLDPETVANGPCGEPINTDSEWVAVGGKVDGANPGFIIRDTSDDRMYLLKFAEKIQIERATSADVIGSKIYWAAGFSTPCNRIVYFDINNLKIGEGAQKKDKLGRKTPIVQADIETAIAWAPQTLDGMVRASASLFLPGKPMGPFQYEETRDADPNDVIAHEDRRELRGSKMLAAWLNHFDAREQNTFTTFMPMESKKGWGYIQHHILDFGDCFGSKWESDQMSRRFGHSSYFDLPHILGDFFSFGTIVRPWETAVEYPDAGPIFGYYDVANFDPDHWANGYPHPAFSRADEVDMFWGAKIISRFSDEHIRRLIEEAHLSNSVNADYLERVMIGRRDKIVHRNFERISPFDTIKTRGMEACVDDLGVTLGYYDAADSHYEIAVEGGEFKPIAGKEGRICMDLLNVPVPGNYIITRLRVRRTHQRSPARATQFHFIVRSGQAFVAGIDRYDSVYGSN